MAQELIAPNHRTAESTDQRQPVPTERFGDDDAGGPELFDVKSMAVGERRCATMVDLESFIAQLVGEAPHGSDHEVRALDVPVLRGEFGGALHEKNTMRGWRSRCQSTDAAIELIAENPHRFHGHSVAGDRCDDPTGTSDSGRLDGHPQALTERDVRNQSANQGHVGANVGPAGHVDGAVRGGDFETNPLCTGDGPGRGRWSVGDGGRTRTIAHHMDESHLLDEYLDNLQTTQQNDEHQGKDESQFDGGLCAVARSHGTRDITLSMT